MSMFEMIWLDVIRVLSTTTLWILLGAMIVAGLGLARALTLSRIRRDEEPVGSAKAMLPTSGVVMFVVFLGLAYALDALSPGMVVVGGTVLILLPVLLAVALGRPIATAGHA